MQYLGPEVLCDSVTFMSSLNLCILRAHWPPLPAFRGRGSGGGSGEAGSTEPHLHPLRRAALGGGGRF